MLRIRWGVIGTGAIAQRFLQGMQHVSESEVTAVWGRNTATAKQLAERIEAVCAKSINELLASDVDAIYIATLPDSHAHYAKAALQAGKAVLCEKPVAMNLTELDGVLMLAQERGQLFMEAMKPPFFPLYQRFLEHLELDPIGPVRFVQSGFATIVPEQHPSWKAPSGGGALMGIGVYHAWLASQWLGKAVEVHATGRMQRGVDAFAALLTKHERGIAQLFCGMDLPSPGRAVLAGSLGYATFEGDWWNPRRIRVNYVDGREIELHENFVGGGLNYEITHFCELLRKGARESPIVPHSTSRSTMALLDQAREILGGSVP